MLIEIGHVESLFRYPVKSMRGERLEVANLGWHGLDGDRRMAFRRINDDNRSGFPWLSASRRSHAGWLLPLRLDSAPRTVEHGIFDDASISVIASDTVCEVARLAGQRPDVRRFRPNVVVRLLRSVPFQEDEWLGGVLSFGEGDIARDNAPAIAVTMRDVRCSMVNFDPDSAVPSPEVLKAVVRRNQNNAGIYGTVTRVGRLAVGQTIFLRPPIEKTEKREGG